MVLVRRAYVYVILAVSLVMLAIGLANLLRIGAFYLWEAGTGHQLLFESSVEIRQQISLNLAFVAVALPIWLLHWYLAERWARREGADGDRASPERALYFAVVLATSLLTWAIAGGMVLYTVFPWAFSPSTVSGGRGAIEALVWFLVAACIWAAHAWVRDRDTKLVQMVADAQSPVRFYLYAAAFGGAVALLVGSVQFLYLAVDALVEYAANSTSPSRWENRLADALTPIVLGGAILGLHWQYSMHLIRDGGWRGSAERASILRAIYLYLGVLAGIAGTLFVFSMSLAEVFRLMLGVELAGGEDPYWARVLRPLLIAAPFGLLWWSHRRRTYVEASEHAGSSGLTRVGRVYAYTVSFLALIIAAIGAGYLLDLGIQYAFDVTGALSVDPQWSPTDASTFMAMTLVGGTVWLWYWSRLQRQVNHQPDEERQTTSRRSYLYLALTASTLALLFAVGAIFYDLMQLALGVRTANRLGDDLSPLLSVTLIAGGLLAYHLSTLLDDMKYRPETVDATAVVPLPEPVSLTFAISGTDPQLLRKLVADFEQSLPAGVEMGSVSGEQDIVERDVAYSEGEPVVTEADSLVDAEIEEPEPEATIPEKRIFT